MLLVLDAVVNFKKNMYRKYDPDSLNSVTLPSFLQEIALKMTEPEVELLKDINMILDNENGIRPGTTRVILHYAKANNKYMLIFDELKKLKSFLN